MKPGRGHRRRWCAAVAVAVAALPLAACGSSTPPPPDPSTVVPAGAPLYVGVTVHPGGQLGSDALAAARTLTGHAEPLAGIEAEIAALAGPGVSFARDIEPWLGQRIGAYFSSLAGGLSLRAGSGSAGAAVAQVANHAAAQSFLDRLTSTTGARAVDYDGTPLHLTPGGVAYGFIGPLAVFGTPAAVLAVANTHHGARALSASSSFASVKASAPADTVAEVHAGSRALVAALPATAATSTVLAVARAVLGSSAIAAVDATLQVPSSSSFVVSATLAGGGGGHSSGPTAAEVFDGLPGDSWLALGTGALGPSLERAIALLPSDSALGTSSIARILEFVRTLDGGPQHLLRWAGPTGVFAAGAGLLDLTAGVVINTSDDAAARAALRPIATRLSSPGTPPTPVSLPGTDAAFSVTVHGLPISIDIAHAPGKVVIGLGGSSVQAALSPTSTLGSSSIGQAAAHTLGGGVKPSLLVDFPTLVSVIDAANELTGSAIFGQLPGVTANLADVVAGTIGDGSDRTVRVAVTLQ